jgi:hypothetical protein
MPCRWQSAWAACPDDETPWTQGPILPHLNVVIESLRLTRPRAEDADAIFTGYSSEWM